MKNLTIFANFFIDTEERLQRMKDSYQSLKDIVVEKFVVNIRGGKSIEAARYLRDHINEINLFMIESSAGWFYDTSKIINHINTPYVLLWIEDHICIAPNAINRVVNEMQDCNADVLTYSFWQNGKFLQRYNAIEQKAEENISWFDHTLQNNSKVKESYIISYASVITRNLFTKIIADKGSERRWPKNTPFDFEKAPNDLHWLPLRRANPKFELFSPIDDDLGEPGSSLQNKGLYPRRIERQTYAHENKGPRLIQEFKKIVRPTRIFLKVLKISLLSPPGFRVDFFNSHYKNQLQTITPLPWMNYEAIIFLQSRIGQIDSVFEFGSGESTKFWQNNNKNIVSIEHDPGFFSNLKAELVNNVDYRLIEPEIDEVDDHQDPTDPYKYHSDVFKGYTFKNYVTAIDDFSDEYFDLIVIDGRARASCLLHSAPKIKKGGLIILDNSDRQRYTEKTESLFSSWKRYVFRGPVRGLLHYEQTTILIKPRS